MDTSIVVALIGLGGAFLGFVGVLITNMVTYKKINNDIQIQATASDKRLETQMAVTNEKINELTREVREHNNFARRMPVVEEQIKVINHRIDDLEKNERK